MKLPSGKLNRLIHLVHRIEDSFLCFLLGLMVILAFVQISGRLFFNIGFSWADPVIYHLVLWVSLAGAVIATREKEHINIDIISRFLKLRYQLWISVLTNSVSSGICGILAWAAFRFLRDEIEMGTFNLGSIPGWPFQVILPAAFTIIAIRFGIHTIQNVMEIFNPGSPE